MAREKSLRLDRRAFLKGAAALTIVAPGAARGAQANSTLELGLIGCGGRGNWIADLFRKNTATRVVAVADYFPDRAERAGARLGVPANRRYSALSGYKRLLEGKLDAVAIESPPYFHPEQAAAAVEAVMRDQLTLSKGISPIKVSMSLMWAMLTPVRPTSC